MNKVEQIHHISKQFLRYFGVALVGYVFDFGTLIFMHEVLHVNALAAASCGFVIGLTVLYVLSRKYVFGESKIKSKPKEFALFALIGLVGLAILNLLMWFMTEKHGINYLTSKIVATIFVYAWNFFARRTLYESTFTNQSKLNE